ncbi:MAG: hypothetical protein A2664_03880 [Candidatus Taylorbacteria bacterium RIFCSPHIGHO2_01_FULL_46_22b]|uniref:CBM-cenC domain-containing protein n=1 Tax=Candidatus Taylorbacteria bacterium RIFCSPHIGHO2_01_FULL_46_22b TaxID=1802301 RepID=A0A1G2M1G7_9BACT|nr:MAG: hypothetical protein A2664_03880 [Candidatus Taylorbacteria bacterium RIFCSPHIGHO2_01_FULL_46_22b]
MTKKLRLVPLAVSLAATLLMAEIASAQSTPPGPAQFLGLPPFTGNILTDPNWNTQIGQDGSVYYEQAQNSASHTNNLGVNSYLLSVFGSGNRANLYITRPNDYSPGTSIPLRHNFSFWYKGSWSSGDYLSTAIVFGNTTLGQLPINTPKNGWTKVSYNNIGPITNSTIKLVWTMTHGSAGFADCWIDAVEWIALPLSPPIVPSGTNFTIVQLNPSSVKISWNTNVYSGGYALVRAAEVTGPYTSFGYSAAPVGNGFVSTTVAIDATAKFFRLVK